jgi:hypothetical protein
MWSKSFETFETKTSSVCRISSFSDFKSISFRENYLFLCQCKRCLSEASEPDETSEEESEDEMDED